MKSKETGIFFTYNSERRRVNIFQSELQIMQKKAKSENFELVTTTTLSAYNIEINST